MKNKMIIGAEVLFSVVSLAGFWSIILVLSNIT
jgi:hypothetical protein